MFDVEANSTDNVENHQILLNAVVRIYDIKMLYQVAVIVFISYSDLN